MPAQREITSERKVQPELRRGQFVKIFSWTDKQILKQQTSGGVALGVDPVPLKRCEREPVG